MVRKDRTIQRIIEQQMPLLLAFECPMSFQELAQETAYGVIGTDHIEKVQIEQDEDIPKFVAIKTKTRFEEKVIKFRLPERAVQRFLSEDGSRSFPDTEIFDCRPVKIQLLIVALGQATVEEEAMMIRAARDDNFFVLEQLLQRPLDPNSTDMGGAPLQRAATNGHSKTVKLLLEAGADRDATTRAERRTPLLLAILGGHPHIVHLLIEAGADKEKAQGDGKTPLGIAVATGNLDIVRFLLEARADKEKVQGDGATPLGIAFAKDNFETACLLIQARADTETVQQNGRTLLEIAAQRGSLGIAAVRGNLEIARLLIEAGADKERVHNNGQTPLGIAVAAGNLEFARTLIQAGADKEKVQNYGRTPLGIAAERGNLDIARLLIEAGADKDKVQNNGRTPLGIAAERGDLETVRLLLEAGADKEKAQEDGTTPLGIAAERGNFRIARLLIEASADTEKVQGDGATPLWTASAVGNLEVVRCLLAAGADKEKSQKDGITALGMAAARGHLGIVRLLLEAGADTEHLANDGQIPLVIAAGEGHLEIVRLLVEHTFARDRPGPPSASLPNQALMALASATSLPSKVADAATTVAAPKKKAHWAVSFVAGFCSGATEVSVTMPLDTVKTFCQVNRTGMGPVAGAQQIYQLKGIQGFYFGLPAVLLQVAGKGAIRFTAFEQFKFLMHLTPVPKASIDFLAGIGAGFAEAFLWTTPTERLKVLRQNDIKSGLNRYSSLVGSIRTVATEHGITGLYAGTSAEDCLGLGLEIMPIFPAVECSEHFVEHLKQMLPDYKIYHIDAQPARITLLKGPHDAQDAEYIAQVCCPGCFDVPYEFKLTFEEHRTVLVDNTEPHPHHRQDEVHQEVARVIASITAVIGRCLEKPTPIGNSGESSKLSDENSKTFQISFTKDGPLGLSLQGEPGRMLVLAVQPESFFETWNRSHPESTVEKGDYLLEAQGWVNLGIGATGIRQASGVGVRFALYGRVKSALTTDPPQMWQSAVAGGITGCCSTLLNNPIDVIKSRIEAQDGKTKEYTGTIQAFRAILKEEGFLAFYKGIAPRLMKISIGQAITFTAYEAYSNTFSNLTGL
eukprot:s354_g14.t1